MGDDPVRNECRTVMVCAWLAGTDMTTAAKMAARTHGIVPSGKLIAKRESVLPRRSVIIEVLLSFAIES
jgi:hypothetical protein